MTGAGGAPQAGGAADLSLAPGALDLLMPLHLALSAEGRVTGAGRTLRKLFAPGTGAGDADARCTLLGRPVFELLEVRRPGGITSMDGLRAHAGGRLSVVTRTPGATGLRGVGVPLAGGGMLLNLSFGIGVIDAVRDHGLTDADFAVTDLAMELLYLVEAKSAVMEELRELNERLQGAKRMAEVQALTDTLTGLRNRRALDLTLADLVDRRLAFGLMHIDLDYFKAVNDTLGHAAGDHVLRRVAQVLAEETRKGDLVARVGGDEFVVVFPGLSDAAALSGIAARMVQRLGQPIDFEGNACLVSASIGIALSTAYDQPTPERLLNDADAALYACKHAGRGRALVHGHPPDSGGPDAVRAAG